MTALTDRARALAESATKGPWRVQQDRDGATHVEQDAPEGFSVCCTGHVEDDPEAQPDAAFIAAARELVPALADALEAAEGERDTCREMFQETRRRMCRAMGVEEGKSWSSLEGVAAESVKERDEARRGQAAANLAYNSLACERDRIADERDEARGRLEKALAALELAILWAKGGRDVIADSGDADEEDIAEATRAIADCEAALDAARREP